MCHTVVSYKVQREKENTIDVRNLSPSLLQIYNYQESLAEKMAPLNGNIQIDTISNFTLGLLFHFIQRIVSLDLHIILSVITAGITITLDQ